MIEEEIWEKVVGFEDFYEVSNLGKVRRRKGVTVYKDGRKAIFSQKILKQADTKKGYKMVYLSVRSKKYSKLVHRLVAKAFIDNPENKATVNHKDSNKKNNKHSNLEWMTNKENMNHAFKSGAFKERDKTTILNIKHMRKKIENGI